MQVCLFVCLFVWYSYFIELKTIRQLLVTILYCYRISAKSKEYNGDCLACKDITGVLGAG